MPLVKSRLDEWQRFCLTSRPRKSVIVHNFYIKRVSFMPPKANPVLIVDANAVLSRAIASERLQIVSRRNK